MWKSIGSYVDGWAKFGVAVAAVGWFGLQVADRYAPHSATVTIGEPPAAPRDVNGEQNVVTENVSAVAEAVATPSVINRLVDETVASASSLIANTAAQLVAVLALGLTGGLALQPKVSRWREARAVRAARRRADRHALDLRLLAAQDAKKNVPGPAVGAIQPMKRH